MKFALSWTRSCGLATRNTYSCFTTTIVRRRVVHIVKESRVFPHERLFVLSLQYMRSKTSLYSPFQSCTRTEDGRLLVSKNGYQGSGAITTRAGTTTTIPYSNIIDDDSCQKIIRTFCIPRGQNFFFSISNHGSPLAYRCSLSFFVLLKCMWANQ
jgi:hypothetical protein